MKGSVKNNQIRSKFDGIISLVGNKFDETLKWMEYDYIFKKDSIPETIQAVSRLSLSPKLISFMDINAEIDTTSINGNLTIKSRNKRNYLVGALHVSDVNYEDYIIADNIDGYQEQGKWDNLVWLQNVNIDVDIELIIDNLIMKDRNLENASFFVVMTQGSLILEHIQINSPSLQLVGDIGIVARETRPLISVNLRSKYMNLSKNPDSSTDEEVNFAIADANHEQNSIWSKTPIKLGILGYIDGDIDISIDNIITKNAVINNSILKGKLYNGLFSIKRAYAEIYDGNITVNGNIGLGNPSSLMITFSLSNIELGKLLANSLDINHVEGSCSMSGSIITKGNSIYEWARNSGGKLHIAARNIKNQEMNLKLMPEQLFSVENESDLTLLTDRILFSGETIFRTIDGKIDMDKGMASSSLTLRTDRISGAIVANIALADLMVNGLARYLFIPTKSVSNEVVSVDMHIRGLLKHPEISFDIDALRDLVFSGKSNLKN